MTIDEQKLMAYADGESVGEEKAAIEAAIAADPTLAEAITRHNALRRAIAGAFEPVLAEPLPPVLAATAVGLAVVDLAEARERQQIRRASFTMRWGALAATLALGVVGGYLLAAPSGMIGTVDGTLVARGDLSEALENQLAVEDPASTGSVVRIGLTFRDEAGAWCRSFAEAQEGAISGIACREGDHWHLRMAIATKPKPGADYRMAGSDEQILLSVQSMISGQPLVAAEERKVRDKGWAQR